MWIDIWILVSDLCNTLDESPCGQFPWAIHSLSIIIWAPGGTVNINMLWIETQGSGLHSIRHISIQHPYTCSDSDSYTMQGIWDSKSTGKLMLIHYTTWILKITKSITGFMCSNLTKDTTTMCLSFMTNYHSTHWHDNPTTGFFHGLCLTYLTPWSRVLLGTIIVAQLDKKPLVFYKTWGSFLCSQDYDNSLYPESDVSSIQPSNLFA